MHGRDAGGHLRDGRPPPALEWRDVAEAREDGGLLVAVRRSKGEVAGALRALGERRGAVDPGERVIGLGEGRRHRAAPDRPLGPRRAGQRADCARGPRPHDVMRRAGNWKTACMVARYSAGASAERGAVARYL